MKKVFLSVFSVMFMLFAVVGIGGITASAEETNLKMSVTLTEDITFNFEVTGASDYATAKMHFAYLDGKEKEAETTLENGAGVIKFSELPAQYMAEEVTVTLTLVKADGTEDEQAAQTVSLRSYARKVLNELTDGAQDKALKKLVVDMLYYGDAAQNYLAESTVADSAKATAVLTEAEKKAYALAEKAEKSDYALEDNASADMRWVRYGAKFDSRLGVFFEFVAKNGEDLSVKFNDGTTLTNFETRTETINGVETTVYKAIKYLSVLDYTSPVTATLYSGSTAIGSPITYSVNSLTCDFEETANEYALAIAATTYASSAVDYKNGVGYFYFEAEDERTALTKGTYGQLEVKSTFVGNLNGNKMASIEFLVKATKATTATLYASITQWKTEKSFADMLAIEVNGETITSAAIVPADPYGYDFVHFITVKLAIINLIEGNNTVSFTVPNYNNCGNFDKIILKCADSLEWGEDSHECSEVCSLCGGCMNEDCGRYACKTKCTCEELKIEAEDYTAINNPLPEDGSKGTFGINAGSGASGEKYIGGVNDVSGVDYIGKAYLEYVIYSDKDTTVDMWIGAGIISETNKSALGVTIAYADESNADFTATDGKLPTTGYWTRWQKVNYGKINLKKGKNVIRITVNGSAPMNLDYFTFRALSGANLRTTAE